MTPLLGELFAAAFTVPTVGAASIPSRRLYLWSLRRVLRVALDTTEPVDDLPVSILSKETARKFFAEIEARRLLCADQSAQARMVRSAYSIHRNAMALTSVRVVEALRGPPWRLKLPDLSDWQKGRKLFSRGIPAAPACVLPDDLVLRRTWRAWIDLARCPAVVVPCARRLGPLSALDQRNLFILVGLCLSCGLRVGEAVQSRWDWWKLHSTGPLLFTDKVRVKNRSGGIEVVPIDPFWRILNFWVDRNKWRQPGAFCLAERLSEAGQSGNLRFRNGGHCDRTFWPVYLASAWLRGLGWQTQKTSHALRDFSASMITMRYGLGAAKDWCRHKSIVTTERHYNRFVSLSQRVSPNKLAWIRWAK